MKTIYIADDGKQFDDECECKEYEYSLAMEKAKDIIRGLDEDGDPIKFSDLHFCDRVYTVYLATNDAVEFFIDRCYKEQISTDGLENPGVYIWDNDEWADIEWEIEQHERRIKRLNKMISALTAQ